MNLVLILFDLTGVRTNEEGVPLLEENFDEAITHVNTALVPTKVCVCILALMYGCCTYSVVKC